MPLGAHVIYEVELAAGVSLKLSEPREGQITMRQTGDRVHVAPTSPRRLPCLSSILTPQRRDST